MWRENLAPEVCALAQADLNSAGHAAKALLARAVDQLVRLAWREGKRTDGPMMATAFGSAALSEVDAHTVVQMVIRRLYVMLQDGIPDCTDAVPSPDADCLDAGVPPCDGPLLGAGLDPDVWRHVRRHLKCMREGVDPRTVEGKAKKRVAAAKSVRAAAASRTARPSRTAPAAAPVQQVQSAPPSPNRHKASQPAASAQLGLPANWSDELVSGCTLCVCACMCMCMCMCVCLCLCVLSEYVR